MGRTRRAVKFGIYSVTPVVLAFERQADWLAHRASLFEDLAPEGYMQEIIVERIVLKPALSGSGGGGGHEGTWRLRRLVRYEREQVRNRRREIPFFAKQIQANSRLAKADIHKEGMEPPLTKIPFLQNELRPRAKG